VLILADAATPESVADAGIERAVQLGCELVVASILDRSTPAKMAKRFMDSGTMGARPSEGVCDSLNRRQEALAAQRAEEIVRKAVGRGVKARSEVCTGSAADGVAALLARLRPTVVVIGKRRRALLPSRPTETPLDKLGATLGFELLEA